jgi:drug/metabolite transporter (DMT)-like permease
MNAFADQIAHLPHLGEYLALASAVAWAIAVILFRVSGRTVSPIGLNLFKNVFALLLFLAIMPVLGRKVLPAASFGDCALLLASGFLGVAVSDTLFLTALNTLGASFLAIVDCVYSPFIIVLSYFFLGERLNLWQLAGVLLIAAAIGLLAWKSPAENGMIPRRDLVRGIVLGILAMLTVAVGIVMIKPMLAHTDVFWATSMRLLGGIGGLILVLPFHPRRREILRSLAVPANWKSMVPASIFGSFLSLLFWVAGMKYTLATVAAVLNQMNVIFIFILAAVFLKEKASPWKIFAVLLAFLGAFLASFPG